MIKELTLIFILIFTLSIIINWKKYDNFRSYGLTVVKPPDWWEPTTMYDPESSKTRMYLDRYPTSENPEKANEASSSYRDWKI